MSSTEHPLDLDGVSAVDPTDHATGAASTMSRRRFVGGAAAAGAVLAGRPVAAGGRSDLVHSFGPEVATDWVRVLYGAVMAEGLTPPAAARFYHYAAVAMYEAAVPGMPGFHSLAGQLTGLERAPAHVGGIDWPAAVSTSVATVAAGLLPSATAATIASLSDRNAAVLADRRAVVGPRTLTRSTRHGERVAERILAWIASDGYAEARWMPYTPPVGPALWRSTPPNFGTAIEPHWSLVRPAVLRTADEVEPAPPVPFATEPGSDFHEQAMTTYRQSSINSEDQIAIARFWTDNPRLSGLPSGHWFLLLAQVAEEPLGLALDESIEAFARLGVALHDAFLNCWTWKYRYNLLRPVSYVRDHVDPAWNTLVNTPQFPEYTSGHSVASGAAEVVLTSLLGSFAFTDSSGLPRGLPARSFTSFTHAAEEAAVSRLYGGIHYPMGIEHGVAQGREIGALVDQRLRTARHRRHHGH